MSDTNDQLWAEREAELSALLERRLCGEATDADAERIEELLAAEPTLFAAYLRRVHLHVCLEARFRLPASSLPKLSLSESSLPASSLPASAAELSAQPTGASPSPRRRLVPTALAAAAALAAVAALALGLRWLTPSSTDVGSADVGSADVGSADVGSADVGSADVGSAVSNSAEPTAQLTRAVDAEWEPAALAVGESAHRFALRAGLAEIRYASGVTVVLQGPALLEIAGPARGSLRHGRLVATVPSDARGFVIATPTAAVTDLGTEFGVACDAAGHTETSDTTVQVYRGEVVAEALSEARPSDAVSTDRPSPNRPSPDRPSPNRPSPDRPSPDRLHLTSGQAAVITASSPTPTPVAFVADRFVRRFPSPGERKRETGLPETPYNVPSLTELRIRPAPGPVAVDGELDDWDLAGEFRGRCGEPFGGDYHVRGAMMYDADGVYIAAVVGDPDPLRNVYGEGDANPWRGGAVQIRLCSDPTLGWPINADSTLRPLRPQDRNPRLCHLTLWHSATLKAACLQIAHGMDYHGVAANPVGFRGAVRPVSGEGGPGYRLEYFVPWRLLGVTDDRPPPRAGDVTGVSWTVHWSDAGGRNFRGQWVDIVHPDHRRVWTFQKAYSWGRAVWEPIRGKRGAQ